VSPVIARNEAIQKKGKRPLVKATPLVIANEVKQSKKTDSPQAQKQTRGPVKKTKTKKQKETKFTNKKIYLLLT